MSRGEITPAVALEKKGDGARLRVRAQSVALGSVGAYEFLPSEIVCAFDADFRRIAALLKSAAERPDGLVIPKKQIAPVCSQIIAPARATVVRGRELVQKHTPMEMTARFYIDCGEENALLCRPEWLYGAARGAPRARMRRISAGTRSARISCFCAYSRFFRRKRRNGSMPLTGRMTPATSC